MVPATVAAAVGGPVTVVVADTVLAAVLDPVADPVVDDVTVGAALPVPDTLAVPPVNTELASV